MLADLLEVLGDVLTSVRGPRFVHGRIRLIQGEAAGLALNEEVAGEATVDHRSITMGEVHLLGVAVAQASRVSYLEEVGKRAEVLRIEFETGLADWTVPEARAAKLRKRIGATA